MQKMENYDTMPLLNKDQKIYFLSKYKKTYEDHYLLKDKNMEEYINERRRLKQ